MLAAALGPTAGVPVFLADLKGDLSGLAAPGEGGGMPDVTMDWIVDEVELVAELAALSPVPVHIRAHHLLVTGDGTPALKWGSTNAYTEDAQGRPVYDWTVVDRIFDTYLERGVLTIGFTTGIHPRYHLPADEARHLDPAKVAAIGRTVFVDGGLAHHGHRVFHRVLQGHDVDGVGVDVVQDRVQRRGLAAAGGAGDQDDALGPRHHELHLGFSGPAVTHHRLFHHQRRVPQPPQGRGGKERPDEADAGAEHPGDRPDVHDRASAAAADGAFACSELCDGLVVGVRVEA